MAALTTNRVQVVTYKQLLQPGDQTKQEDRQATGGKGKKKGNSNMTTLESLFNTSVDFFFLLIINPELGYPGVIIPACAE